ncbi:MAG: hypothetical protein KOO65_08620 [Desulfobacterales bacterium]|nr:hypothetical protein [Desulfobacterales bacterium]
MNKLLCLAMLFCIGCEPATKVEKASPPLVQDIVKAVKELPDEYEIKIVVETGEEGKNYSYEGESYTATDKYFGARIMSPFGVSAIEGSINRKPILLDTKAGKISAGGGDLSLIERLWIAGRNIIFFSLGGIALLFGATFIPGVSVFAKPLFSALPILGGAYQAVTKGKITKDIVESVQKAKDTLLPDDREAFNNKLAENQDKSTKKVVKSLKD